MLSKHFHDFVKMRSNHLFAFLRMRSNRSPPLRPPPPPPFRSLTVVSQNHKYFNSPDCISAHIHLQKIRIPLEYSWPLATRSATRTNFSPKRKILDRILACYMFRNST